MLKLRILILLILGCFGVYGQSDADRNYHDSLTLSGQVSMWSLYSNSSSYPVWVGGRYQPQLNYELGNSKGNKFDTEISLNVNGLAGFKPFTSNMTDGDIKLYRSWIRFSGDQYEVRLGLQKINFGSASLLRPLMWFDKIDPLDPLQITDGVWGLLGRYYFLNNLNIWAWTLYGNKQPSIWEAVESNVNIPEFGGRVQFPLKKGEIAISYHHRTADSRHLAKLYKEEAYNHARIPEDRFGIDGRWDVVVGIWFEASTTRKQEYLESLTYMNLLNVGTDYTFGIGNGLKTTLEHLIMTRNERLFDDQYAFNYTALSFSYNIGLTNDISAIIYYDWTSHDIYNFINWNKQINKFNFYLIAFYNPHENFIPIASDSFNMMGGRGLQFMVVYNY